jgi:DNA-binding IclR family transcriptional regulator
MTKRPPGESIGTVQRVIEVLRFFAERGEATLKELSVALSLAPSTCHRLLDLLGRQGLIEQDSVHRRYRVGMEMFRISALVQSREDIRSIARPLLRQLVDSYDETAVLGIYLPVEGKIFFAERVDSSRMLRYQLAMNVPVSVLWGASGRAILAFLDSETIDRIYKVEGRAPGSGEALPSRRALEKDLAVIRERGYDITHGQKIPGAVGISAPVFGADGKVVASVCVTVPESRIKESDYPRLGAAVRTTAHRLSQAIGSPADNTKPLPRVREA